MKVMNISGKRFAIASLSDFVQEEFASNMVDLGSFNWSGHVKKALRKSADKRKVAAVPFSMSKLLKLEDMDEYYHGCLQKIRDFSIMQFQCRDQAVQSWIDSAVFQDDDPIGLLQEMVGYYRACGNGILIKTRDLTGKWGGLERLLPTECQLLERYENNFPKPDYVQTRNRVKTLFKYDDIIHLKLRTRKSDFWGCPSLSVVQNVYTLAEIKTFHYNNFKNGMLIDYVILVQGGSLNDDGEVENEDGEVVEEDIYTTISKAFAGAKGNENSHRSIILETEDKDVKIELVPLKNHSENGYLELRKDERGGIFTYFGIPKRIVAQEVEGKLGGDNNSDITMMYVTVVKPIQNKLSRILARAFRDEGISQSVTANDFEFGDIREFFKTSDEKFFESNRNK
jgi:hypothetical protein